MFTQAGAPPPTRDQALQMINQAIKTMLSDQIEQANKAHKEAMQRMKEAFEDQ
jgi:predicted RNase H-like HicB family nuclease